MKPYLKFTLLVALCFFTALLIGFVVQYFFNYKIYVPLVIGSMVPLLMAWKNIKGNQAKQ